MSALRDSGDVRPTQSHLEVMTSKIFLGGLEWGSVTKASLRRRR